MKPPPPAQNLSSNGSPPGPMDVGLPLRHNKVVLVLDLVESVRLMAANEARVVQAWRGLCAHADTEVLPRYTGRVVKSLGDGLLAEFDRATDAVAAALAFHRFLRRLSAPLPAEAQMFLRAGLHTTHFYEGERDVYGSGVNLAARVASLARPGETVVTAEVRDQIVDGMDADLEDMGECYLKHWPEPVRTWRAWPAGSADTTERQRPPLMTPQELRPTVAVIPFVGRAQTPEHEVIGDLIADGVITQLSRTGLLRVISRLSTNAFKGRTTDLADISAHLAAGFVLSGSYTVFGERVVINAELADVRRNDVIWADRLIGLIEDLLQLHSQLIQGLADASSQALIQATVQRALVLPVPQLESHALLLGGINLMHRSSARDLDRSRELLEAVSERHNRVATPWTWLAKWHIFNVVQGRSPDASNELQHAIQLADRALDLEPTSSLALAIKGHVQCHLGTQLDESRQLLLQATDINPNDHTAWLYAGFWSTMWGNPADAVRESEKALELSPLDPQRFFIEMLVAHSYLMADDLQKAVDMCEISRRRNRCHLATLRILLTAHHELGNTASAKQVLDELCARQVGLTVGRFLAYGSESRMRLRIAAAMRSLGLPD